MSRDGIPASAHMAGLTARLSRIVAGQATSTTARTARPGTLMSASPAAAALLRQVDIADLSTL
jgi:hypothetical protein